VGRDIIIGSWKGKRMKQGVVSVKGPTMNTEGKADGGKGTNSNCGGSVGSRGRMKKGGKSVESGGCVRRERVMKEKGLMKW
jgi:hypothetical protein